MSRDRHVVSVVIPTIGRSSLKRCQEALAKQTRPPDEVIVVHDVERRGPVWARNEGIRRSRGDLIAFTDDDCVPPADWLERLIEAISRHEAVGAGGTFHETDPLLACKRARRRFPKNESVDTEGWIGNSGHVMYRRSWLDLCAHEDGSAFNEAFQSNGEDVELAWRLRRRGAKLVFVPQPVWHLRRVTARQYMTHQFHRGQGIARLWQSHRLVHAPIAAQKSLLWGRAGRVSQASWWQALWLKAIGSFDVGSFRTPSQFVVFWIGEKCEAAGFLWQLLHPQRVRSDRVDRESR